MRVGRGVSLFPGLTARANLLSVRGALSLLLLYLVAVGEIRAATSAAAFRANAGYRMRDIRQFSPQSLHNHACILNETATVNSVKDHFHIYSGQGVGAVDGTIAALLQNIDETPDIKMLCINDLPQLEALYPDIRCWLAQAVTGVPRSSSTE